MNISRRKVLSTLGGVSIVGLSGCGSGSKTIKTEVIEHSPEPPITDIQFKELKSGFGTELTGILSIQEVSEGEKVYEIVVSYPIADPDGGTTYDSDKIRRDLGETEVKFEIEGKSAERDGVWKVFAVTDEDSVVDKVKFRAEEVLKNG